MEIVVIILIIAAAAASAVVTVVINRKKEEKQKYYMAAGNILKGEFLDYALQNPADGGNNGMPNGRKMMLYIKSLNTKPKQQFVFDPEKPVLIGREQGKSNIYINEAFVSQYHCRIFSNGPDVYLQDMNSLNGTVVKKGLFCKIRVINGSGVKLSSGDIIRIGSNKFKVILFFYDMVFY